MDYKFESWIAEALHEWPVEWRTHFVWEYNPKRGTVQIMTFLMHNGEHMRCDYEVDVVHVEVDEDAGVFTEDFAEILVKRTKDFIDECLAEGE